MPVDLIKFINHISLNFILIVHLLSKYKGQILQIIKKLESELNFKAVEQK